MRLSCQVRISSGFSKWYCKDADSPLTELYPDAIAEIKVLFGVTPRF